MNESGLAMPAQGRSSAKSYKLASTILSQISICIRSTERVFDPSSVDIPALLPGIDCSREGVAVVQEAIRALAIENANFDFSHAEPAGMFPRGATTAQRRVLSPPWRREPHRSLGKI